MKIAIVGTVGVPASYGGFETLAENLVEYNDVIGGPHELSVYCSSWAYPIKLKYFKSARLHYLPLAANGWQAMFYDMLSLLDAVFRKNEVIILLGHGGSFLIPILKLFTNAKFVTNIDGIEWWRNKWSAFARMLVKNSESFAVKYSHKIIADNEAIRDYVFETYGVCCEVITYGGDHSLQASADPDFVVGLPESYALALCRIEKENNISMILEAFSSLDTPLVFVGNWDSSEFGRSLKNRYRDYPNIFIRDAIYDPQGLRAVRDRATIYIHGHSAGGTNPSLVEMMHFSIPVFAYDCLFNRYSTEGKARYFKRYEELRELVRNLTDNDLIGPEMGEIAQRRYTWAQVGKEYFSLIDCQWNSLTD